MAKKNIFSRRKFKRIIGVVGEGPSEWHYASDLNKVEDITISLKPTLPRHSNYTDIFKKAKQLIKDGYEEVYCLVDTDVIRGKGDAEIKYANARNKITADKRIKVIETFPCLEFWYLLHFKPFSTKVYMTCEEVINDLKRYIPDYTKSNTYLSKKRIYKYLAENGDLDLAKSSASKLRDKREDEIENNFIPYTEIDLFVEMIKKK